MRTSPTVPFPLAARNRRSDPYLSLLVHQDGRLPGLTCKVHSGKGLPGRSGEAIGRLIQHQGPFFNDWGLPFDFDCFVFESQ